MNWTKKNLEKAIEEAKVGVEMIKQILVTVKEFEHHIEVNKRFTNKLNEIGLFSYITKDKFSTTLLVSKSDGYGTPRAEFRIYCSHNFSSSALTWDRIKVEIERHNFDRRLSDAKERLSLIDKETVEAKALLELIKSKKFKCFDFCKSIWEIEDAVKEALK